eukprot:m.192301 g.192301  ORF g.192301 m.192301 type:complete len:67 (+) comp15168_c0_seq4:1476-1676(+)
MQSVLVNLPSFASHFLTHIHQPSATGSKVAAPEEKNLAQVWLDVGRQPGGPDHDFTSVSMPKELQT